MGKVDYSYLILKNSDKVEDFINKYGIFFTDAQQFWDKYKYLFEYLSEGKQKEIFKALCEIEKYCIKLLTSEEGR
jgi:hypothetical protein